MKKKPQKTAAVVITCRDEAYETKLREARQQINLADLDIDNMKVRRAITGGYVLEVAGENKAAKADQLAAKLRDTIGRTEGIKITRPCKTAELRIKSLDESITPNEVREVLACKGQCSTEEVRVGNIRKVSSGLGTIWAKCPLVPANRIAEAGKIQVGWTAARVEMLADRPLQCYKCLERGHVAQRCPSNADRSGRCYRFGEVGHQARGCTREIKCPVCADNKLPTNHKVGSLACQSARKRKRGRSEGVPPLTSPLNPQHSRSPRPLLYPGRRLGRPRRPISAPAGIEARTEVETEEEAIALPDENSGGRGSGV